MSIKNLVIFTERFPYYGGEQFLELEVVYLANKFENVIIYPRTTSDSVRKLPENVSVCIVPPHLSYNELLAVILDRNTIIEALYNFKFAVSPKGVFRIFNFAVYGKRVQRWISQLSVEVIESTCFYSYWMSHAAVGIAWSKKDIPNLKFITRGHGWDIYSHIHNPPYLPFRSLIFNMADRIYPVSEAGANYMRDHSFLTSEKIRVARLGVARPSHLTRQSDDNVFRIVSCSNMITLKRIELIVEIIAQLASHPDFTKRIVWTHFGDGPLRDALAFQATESLTDHIEWKFAGNVKNSDILKFYAENPIDVFINTSSSEGIPVSIMEAQAYGIPVLATNVGGVSEIVNDDNGFLLEADFKIEKAVKYLIRISHDRLLMNSLRQGSVRSWTNKYSSDSNYSSFYEEIIALEHS